VWFVFLFVSDSLAWANLNLVLFIAFAACVGVVLFSIFFLHEGAMVRAARQYAAELGKVVLDQSSMWRGVRLVIRPVDSRLERVELSEFLVSRMGRRRWRMLVELAEDTEYTFEMSSKLTAGVGRVFTAGDGMVGGDHVNRVLWTETAVRKRVTALLLGDSEVRRTYAVATNRGLRSLRVEGNRIALEFDRGVGNARAMFALVHLLSPSRV